MYEVEYTIIRVLIITAIALNITLTIMNLALIRKLDWSPPPSYFADVLMLCSVLGTGATLPGGVTEFNQQLVEALTFNFGNHPTVN
jgi:hypothetical protein